MHARSFSVCAGLATLLCALLAPLPGSSRADAGVVLYDLSVASDGSYVVGAPATVTAKVTRSRDLNESRPVGGARVVAELVTLDDRGRVAGVLHRLGSVTTGRDGRAVIEFLPPRSTSSSVGLRVSTTAAHGKRQFVRPIQIAENVVLHLRTDRGVYRPGTDIRWRVTALHGIHSHPIANVAVDVEIKNPSNAPIWRGTLRTDSGGMISGAIPMASDALTGRYRLSASAAIRGARTNEYVVVRPIELPPFLVTIESTPKDPRPGQKVQATVTARYPHGEPVAGDVSMVAVVDDLELVSREAKLDRFGKMTLEFTPPIGERGTIAASVVDGARRKRGARAEFDLPGASLRLALVPETHRFAPGKRRVHVITTDGRGNLVPSQVRLEWTGAERRRTVKSPGVVVIPIDVRDGLSRVRLVGSATAADGRVAVSEQAVGVDTANAATATIVEPLVEAGAAVDVRAMWPERDGPVVATLLRRGTPLASTLVDFSRLRAGRGVASLRVPTGAFGLATVRLSELRFDRKTGRLTGRSVSRIVYLQRRRLDVKIDNRVRHAPGEGATAQVIVTHPDGAPALGVRIAAAVVDERVLALSEPRPDLVAVLDGLGSTSAMVRRGGASRAGLLFADLLRGPPTPVTRGAMVALLATMPPDETSPQVLLTEALRVEAEAARMHRADSAIGEHMFKTAQTLGRRDSSSKKVRWSFALAMDRVLDGAGWTEEQRFDPWKRPTTWTYARTLLSRITFERHAALVVSRRLDTLVAVLEKRKRFKRWLRLKKVPASLAELPYVEAHLRVDPWGTPIALAYSTLNIVSLTSAGPDQTFGTKDDERRERGNIGTIGSGYGTGSGGGTLGGRRARAPQVRIGNAGIRGGIEANVRKRFDETVLWQTGIPTDARGVATLEVPLADSVTGWQLDIEAVGPRGGVGVARGRFETHLARYVDAAMPAGLSVGDQFRLPLVVANHTAMPAPMSLTVEARGAIKMAGRVAPSDTVAPHSTRAFGVDLVATEPGEGVLTVTMRVNGKSVDAFERRLRVEHPGALVRRTHGEMFDDGSGVLSFKVDGAAPKTARGRLRLFRGSTDRAIDGIEALVREPHGCFEQTSSATYPNLLVIRLLRQKGSASSSAIVERARRFVARGYQRLISYEVDGGGFSWFGSAPANQVLTAYGLMEFVDMSAVYPVDKAMVSRTRRWLLEKQRSDGSWRESKNTLGGESALATTAYIAWALAESGYRGPALSKALAYLGRQRSAARRDAYVLSLWAAAEARLRKSTGIAGRELAKTFVTSGKGLKVVRAVDAPRALFYASGEVANAHSTALAAMALHHAGDRASSSRALRWVGGAGAGNWRYSTQGTVLALRAMTLAGEGQAPATGVVEVSVNGKRAGKIDLAADDLSGLEIDHLLRSGANAINLRGGSSVKGLLSASADLSWRGSSALGQSSAGLRVERRTSATTLKRGGHANVTIHVRNPGTETIDMPMVIAPIPPGFRVKHWMQRDRRYRHRISKIEDVGSELRIYIDALGPGESRTISYRLTAENVVNVLHRPVTAYAYYEPELRGTSAAGRLIATE